MRIGLYGMPTSGKTYLLDRIDFIEVLSGSTLLREYNPDFFTRDEDGREKARKALAERLMKKESFIMDGHYAFGDETAFTHEDGALYDVFIYLYASPVVLKGRMGASERNRKYLNYDVESWQNREITELRNFCHMYKKDFYIIDNPPENEYIDVESALGFIRSIVNGYSCVAYAERCVEEILKSSNGETILLIDGDRTLTREDSSNKVFGYTTNIFDGNFYTGYQAWRQREEFKQHTIPDITQMPVHLNDQVRNVINSDTFILTSGHEKVWRYIAGELGVPFFYGSEMSAEAKLYITKSLQDSGKTVIAYGDGMNDYFMLIQADKGYLVSKQDGQISRSLKGKSLEGLSIV